MNREELITRYFESELTQEEVKEFEYLVEHDEEFRKEVGFQENLKTVISRVERKKLKTYLKDLDGQKWVQKSDWSSYYRYGVAAAVVLIMAVGYLLYVNRDQTVTYSREEIMAFYEPYPNVITPNLRAENREVDQQRAAFIAYERGDYRMADSLFTTLLSTGDHFHFYKGIAKFELAEYDSAAFLFDRYIQSNNSQLYEQSLWYLALSNLLRGETEAGKDNLSHLKRQGKYKSQEVDQLLPKL